MSARSDEHPPASSGFRILFRVVDSALIIAVAFAVLNYASWTFRLAYLKRFSIDPSSLDASAVSIAVDGVGAVGTTLLGGLAACAFLLAAGAGTWATVWLVERWRGNGSGLADRSAVMIAQSAGIAFAMLFVLGGGAVAGRWAAEQRIANVRNGEVWHYHVWSRIVPAVPIAQGSTTTWLG